MTIKSDFTKNVLTLLTGTSIAQAIPVAVSPLLTRLYSPEEFGIFSLFMTFNAIAFILATGRYELALMLPKGDTGAINVLGLAVSLTFLISLIILFVTIISSQSIANLLNAPKFSIWLYILPLSVGLNGLYQILCSWLNRNRRYLILASCDVSLKFVSEITKLAIGFARKLELLFVNGLVVGYVLGFLSAVGILIWKFIKLDWEKTRLIKIKAILSYARIYKKFPIYNVPYSLIGSVSQGSMIIALSFFGFLKEAGYFGFVKSAMFLPISLLSTSLGRVFFKEAVENFGSRGLEKKTIGLMAFILDLFTPVFVLFIFYAPEIFKIVFGSEWIEAGHFAAIFAPAAFLFLFTSWPTRIFEVAQKQQISFFIQLIWDALIVSSIFVALYLGIKPIYSVALYTILLALYHVTYLIAIFKVANFRLSGIGFLISKLLIRVILLALTIFSFKVFIESELNQWICSVLATLLCYGIIALFRFRQHIANDAL